MAYDSVRAFDGDDPRADAYRRAAGGGIAGFLERVASGLGRVAGQGYSQARRSRPRYLGASIADAAQAVDEEAAAKADNARVLGPGSGGGAPAAAPAQATRSAGAGSPVNGIHDFLRSQNNPAMEAARNNRYGNDSLALEAAGLDAPSPIAPGKGRIQDPEYAGLRSGVYRMPSQDELDKVTANAPNTGLWDYDADHPERNSRDAGEVIRQRVTVPGIAEAAARAQLAQEQEKARNPYGDIEAKGALDLRGIAAGAAAQRELHAGMDADRSTAIDRAVQAKHAEIDHDAKETLRARLARIPPEVQGIQRQAMTSKIAQDLQQEVAHAKDQAAVNVYASYGIQRSPTLATAGDIGGLPGTNR